jgi:hypothetical protein
MKAVSQPSIISPTIILLFLLAAGVVFIGATGRKVPFLSDIRIDILLLAVLGMAICSQGGIGRIAASGQWAHPQAILGYFLGGLILIIALFSLFGWTLPFIQTGQQVLLVIAGLAVLKFANAAIHFLLFKS